MVAVACLAAQAAATVTVLLMLPFHTVGAVARCSRLCTCVAASRLDLPKKNRLVCQRISHARRCVFDAVFVEEVGTMLCVVLLPLTALQFVLVTCTIMTWRAQQLVAAAAILMTVWLWRAVLLQLHVPCVRKQRSLCAIMHVHSMQVALQANSCMLCVAAWHA